MKGLLAILAKPSMGKGKAADSPEEEAAEPESEDSSAEEYKELIADSAKSGDWDAFADAVAGLVRCSKGKM